MARALMAWGLVLLAGQSAVGRGVLLQFSFDGSLVEAEDIFEVAVGETHTIGIFIIFAPEQEVYDAWNVVILPTGPWDPFANMASAPGGDPVFYFPWYFGSEYGPLPFGAAYDFGSFWSEGVVNYPAIVLDFPVHIPEVPTATTLNLELDPVWTEVSRLSVPLQVTILSDLKLHVVPDPATVVLLALGGLAAVMGRRR